MKDEVRFADRTQAGRQLAVRLRELGLVDPVVLGLPRGGVPVAAEVARALHAPLDVIVVRKLGVPFQPELAMGAIGEDGALVVDFDVVRATAVTDREFEQVESRERAELARRTRTYRGDQPGISVAGRTVVIIDDGVATGSTARVACRVARDRGASRVILAVPVGPPGTEADCADAADDVVCLHTPPGFFAVGSCYADFRPVSDAEVADLLDRARGRGGWTVDRPADDVTRRAPRDGDVVVQADHVALPGRLTLPAAPGGIVVFAHGSGSSRHSPRNRYVADILSRAGLGTLLFDLLTAEEERLRSNVFDIDRLAERLRDATAWLRDQPATASAPIGYFGASTGAAAALVAAAHPDANIAAVVSRGGRPDLAGAALAEVRAPTLLIVGGRDDVVLELNRRAQTELRCANRLEIVSGATHLFEEPGTLESAAALARNWFERFLSRPTAH